MSNNRGAGAQQGSSTAKQAPTIEEANGALEQDHAAAARRNDDPFVDEKKMEEAGDDTTNMKPIKSDNSEGPGDDVNAGGKQSLVNTNIKASPRSPPVPPRSSDVVAAASTNAWRTNTYVGAASTTADAITSAAAVTQYAAVASAAPHRSSMDQPFTTVPRSDHQPQFQPDESCDCDGDCFVCCCPS